MRPDLPALLERHIRDGAVLLLDERGHVLSGAARGARFNAGGATALAGIELSALYPPEARRAGLPRQHLERASRDGQVRVEQECVGLDDRRFPAELVLEALPPAAADGERFACFIADLTEQTRSAEAAAALADARQTARRLAAERDDLLGIVESIARGLLVLDRDWRVLYVNEQAESLLRVSRQDLVGKDLRRKLGTRGTGPLFELVTRALRDRVQGEIEEFYPLAGTWFAIEAYPGPHGVSVLFQDVTARRQEQEGLRSLTLFDPLTGLPNPTLFRERLGQNLAHVQRFAQKLAVIALELDVREVPGAEGAAFRDLLTKDVAHALEPLIRQNDTLGHMGPERWGVIQNLGPLDGPATFAQRLLAALAEIPRLAEMQRHPAAAGIAVLEVDGDTADDLLRAAENAVETARVRGDSYRYANSALHEQVVARKAMEAELGVALERDELRLFFQPEIDMRSGRTLGLEALFRWEHPRRGMLNAGEFLPVAAGSDLSGPLGEWAVRELCAQAHAWREAGVHDVRMSMNATNAQLRDHALPELLATLLAERGLPPDAVELEITERQLLHERVEAEHMCTRLHAVGLHVCVDDFGGEFGPLGALVHPAVRKIKIDASVTARLRSGTPDRSLTAILQLAQVFQLEVVAKGVESDEQVALLQEYGLHRMQGFRVGRPLPAAQLSGAIRQG